MTKTFTRCLMMLLFALYTLVGSRSYGQCPPTSVSITGGPVTIPSGGIVAVIASSFSVGPGAHLTIDGNYTAFVDTVFIDPSAIIDGSGVFHIASRRQSGASDGCPARPTYIDGNGAKVDVLIRNENPNNLVLADLTKGATPTNGQATLYLGKGLDFGTTSLNIFGVSTPVDNNDVILNNYDVRFDNDALTSNYTASRFFVTNGTGHVGKESLQTFIFPVGRAEGDYTPASINASAATSDFFVNVNDYATSASNEQSPSEGIDRTWNIYASNASASATVNLQHNLSTNGGNYTNENAFVTRYIGTAPNTAGGATSQSLWDYTGNCSAGSATGTLVTGSAIIGASELTRAFTTFATNAASNDANYTKSRCDNSPMPVRLAQFRGQWVAGKGNQLTWLTYQEQNNDHFEIQSGSDARALETVGRVAGKGTTTMAQVYEFVDAQPQNELTYYRLKQVDTDGTFTYSSIIAVRRNIEVSNGLMVYPNPVIDELKLQLTSKQTPDEVRIYSLNGGQLVHQTMNAKSISAGNLPVGNYIIEVKTKEGEILRQSFVKY